MTWLWPSFLYLLGLIPLLAVTYILILRRRRRFAVRYSSLALVRAALPRSSWLRQHLPFIFFLLALTGLIAALARPVSIVSVPAGKATIILSLDVSRSMCSTDIQPTRIQAAENAALSFVQRQSSNTQIGLVAFSTFAEVIQPPTSDRNLLDAAIKSLLVGRRTAIGSGILTAIDAIAQVDKNVAPSITDANPGTEPAPVPKGAYVPDIIVLLTDGVSNTGPLPLDAAQQAEDRGVRVYTIGFGTPNGSEFAMCQNSDQYGFGGGGYGGFGFGGGGYGGFGGGFGGFGRGIDEATLKQVAAMTGGTYYTASSAAELQNVFKSLPTYLIMKHETTEVSVFFTAFGAFFAALAVLLALLWHPLP
ncbi:MAG TPA: VWA domain-containing protein [Anaerolineales bacterium]|nr:VWA domain-containing protein [Anaerolineales bacterium]